MLYTLSSDPASKALIVSKLGRHLFAWGAYPLTQALSLMFTLPKYYSLSLPLSHSHISSFLFSLHINWVFSFPLAFVLLAYCYRLLFSSLLISFSLKQIPQWFGFIALSVPCAISPVLLPPSRPSFYYSLTHSQTHEMPLTLKRSASLESLLVVIKLFGEGVI